MEAGTAMNLGIANSNVVPKCLSIAAEYSVEMEKRGGDEVGGDITCCRKLQGRRTGS